MLERMLGGSLVAAGWQRGLAAVRAAYGDSALVQLVTRGIGPVSPETTSLLWRASGGVLATCRRVATGAAEPLAGVVSGSLLFRAMQGASSFALRAGRSSVLVKLLRMILSDLGGSE